MQRDSSSEMTWPVVMVFGFMAVFIFGLTQTGAQLRAEMSSTFASVVSRPATPTAPARAQVLVVTRNHDDEIRIRATVNPRGYQVLVAKTVPVAKAFLESNSRGIGVVVIDSELAGAETLTTLANGIVPHDKVIKLRRDQRATDLAVLLLAAI